jgi:hypothetical protein
MALRMPYVALHGIKFTGGASGNFPCAVEDFVAWRDSANPLGDPLLKARTHIGASGAAGLAIDTSLVGATYSAILRSLGPPARCRQILKSPPSLWNIHIPWVGRARRVHNFRFRNTHLLCRSAWRFIFRRKPWFRLFRFGYFLFGCLLFGPLFRNHNAVVVAQDVAGLRRRRCSQRRRQNDQQHHRGFAHHCHRIKPPRVLASWPLIQSPLITCKGPLGIAKAQKTIVVLATVLKNK